MKTPATYEGNCCQAGKALARRINPPPRASQHSPERGARTGTRPETSSSARPRNSWISDRRGAWRVPACSRTTPIPRSPARYQASLTSAFPGAGPGHWRAISRGRRRRAACAVAHPHVRAFRRSLASRAIRDGPPSPPATSPARTPLTTLVFPHSQAAPQARRCSGTTAGKQKISYFYDPDVATFYYGQGHPMQASPRAHDA